MPIQVQEQLPIQNGNPLLDVQRDELPLERLVVYIHDKEEPVDQSDWPQVWMQRIHYRYHLRSNEASNNIGLRFQMLELLNAANEVILRN